MTTERQRHSSLVLRLVLLAMGWSVGALAISAVVLALLFQQAALRRFDQSLNELVDNLVSGTTFEDGDPRAPALTDILALRTYSGRYWEIARLGPQGQIQRTQQKSRSLWDSDLSVPDKVVRDLKAKPGKAIAYNTRGPLGEPLRAVAAVRRLPEAPSAPLVFLAGEDRSPIDRDVRGFITATAVAFLLLGLGLIAAVVIQVRVGLRPLFDLRREIASVRRGKAERLSRTYPTELTPLADELNALVAHNQETVERQRTHVGNLAHALKTPISVMLAEAQQRPGPLADVVTRQAEAMRQQVDHHLRRARAAARTQGQGERTDVAEVLDELSRTLERIFGAKGVTIDWDAPDDLFFSGERQDLQEIAGNAAENACKWCKSKVRITAEPLDAARLRLTVEDDGPGLAPEQREAVIRRGARLDENAPGSGLGLSILDELARAYGGVMILGDAPLGGLKVEVELPRAEG